MSLKLSISTCPNDTFMFDALIHKRIDTEGLELELKMSDIENLNGDAIESIPHISKISYAVYPLIADRYTILNSGSALGRGNGPLLVSRRTIYPDEMHDATVAVPGMHTTANLLMERLFPDVLRKKPYLFSDIAEAVMSGECDAGVLIHEGRFVYRKHGLRLIADLGVEWEKRTGLPLPLGAIAVSNDIDDYMKIKIDRVIRRSIEYAMANPKDSFQFVKTNARELDDDVIAEHIDLFVNDYSINLRDEGRKAVRELLGIPEKTIFV